MYITGLKRPPVTFLYTMAGIIIAQGFYNFPLIMATVSDSWETIKKDQADSARLLGASEWRVFKTITFYQLFPSIISAAIPVFIFCFFSFMIILLFGSIGCSTLEVEIYQAAKSFFDYRLVSFYALIETLISLGIIVLYTTFELNAQKNTDINIIYRSNTLKPIKGLTEITFFALNILIIAVFFLMPLAGIAVNAFSQGSSKISFSFASILKTIKLTGFIKAFSGTLTTGIFTAVLSTITAFTYSVFLREQKSCKTSLLLKVLPIVPMTVSSVVLGIGLTLLIKRGSIAHLVFAQTIITWPIAFRQIYPYLAKIEQDKIDAAKILSLSVTDTIYKIYLPEAKRGLLSAIGFCFAISAGDTTLPLVLTIPRFDTLSLFTYRLASAYKFHLACSSGLILGIICALVFTLANKVKRIE